MGSSREAEKPWLQQSRKCPSQRSGRSISVASAKYGLAVDRPSLRRSVTSTTPHSRRANSRLRSSSRSVKLRERASRVTLNLALPASPTCCGLRHCLGRGTSPWLVTSTANLVAATTSYSTTNGEGLTKLTRKRRGSLVGGNLGLCVILPSGRSMSDLISKHRTLVGTVDSKYKDGDDLDR